MNAVFGRLSQTVLVTIFIIAGFTGLLMGVVAPRFLLIDPVVAHDALIVGVSIGVPTLLLVACVTWFRLYRLRFTLRALELGSASIEPEELEALDKAPSRIASTAVVLATIGAVVAVPFRPQSLDLDTAISMISLAVAFTATASLPIYLVVRRQVARAVQVANESTMRELLERISHTREPRRRMLLRVLFAVVLPVALVGFGVAILTHAHVKAFETRGREAIATSIAQAALEPIAGTVPTAGENDAALAAAQHGFSVRLAWLQAPFSVVRRPNGRVVMAIPLDIGHASISFEASTFVGLTGNSVLAAIISTLLAALLAGLVGASIVKDLAQATRQVQLLGTESVLRGSTQVARPARFAVVSSLGEAIEKLADRFRVFASTQERAIEAREDARRMRGLIFASVSHDLKSPLNTILGFSDLIDDTHLSDSQKESLTVIKERAREFLTLIQTILDAARVEAGQLVLQRQVVSIDDCIFDATRMVRRQANSSCAPIMTEINLAIPPLFLDRERITDAIASLLRHAAKTAENGMVTVRADVTPSQREVIVDIDVPTHVTTADEIAKLMRPEGGQSVSRFAGGLTLGLSLARSVVLLQGGDIQVIDSSWGIVMRMRLPLGDPSEREG